MGCFRGLQLVYLMSKVMIWHMMDEQLRRNTQLFYHHYLRYRRLQKGPDQKNPKGPRRQRGVTGRRRSIRLKELRKKRQEHLERPTRRRKGTMLRREVGKRLWRGTLLRNVQASNLTKVLLLLPLPKKMRR